MSLAMNINHYLLENGIRRKFIVDKTGMTQNAVCLTLNGQRKLAADEYIKICDALGVPYDFFVSQNRETA